jgi:hypothetical protein
MTFLDGIKLWAAKSVTEALLLVGFIVVVVAIAVIVETRKMRRERKGGVR